jgi:hypothetical protein
LGGPESFCIERFAEIIRLLARIGPHHALITRVEKQKLFSGMGPHSPSVPDGAMTIATALLTIIVPTAMVLALAVDLVTMWGWLKRRWR